MPVWDEPVPLTPALSDQASGRLAEGGATCVLCVNDLVAMAAPSHLWAIGVPVGTRSPHRSQGAVSIVGFDDVTMAGWPLVALTTVRQSLAALGATAVDLLAARLADPARAPQTMVLPVSLVARATTAPPHWGRGP